MSVAHDERTVAVARLWAARGWLLLATALAIDVVVRATVLRQDPRQFLDIALIWLGTSLVAGFGMTGSGVAPYGGRWSQAGLAIALIAVVSTLVVALLGMVRSWTDAVSVLLAGAAGAFVLLVVLRGIYGLWRRRTLGRDEG